MHRFIVFALIALLPVSVLPRDVHAESRLSLDAAEGLIRHYITNSQPKMNHEAKFPVRDMTTSSVWDRLQAQVFKVTAEPANMCTFVIKDKTVYPIGGCFGGWGVMSMAVADLDEDSSPELYYTHSWGSGIHRSQIGVFFKASDGWRTVDADFAYLGELVLSTKTLSSVEVLDATLKNPTNAPVELDFIPNAPLGTISLMPSNNEFTLKVNMSPILSEELRKRIWKK